MSDNENNENKNKQEQKPQKITPESIFKNINQEKIKIKGQELKAAVQEQMKADDLKTAADEKVNKIFEEIQILQTAKYKA